MLPASKRPGLVLALVTAQLCATGHLALVPHTSSVSGRLAEQSFSIEEHLDATAHLGSHAHLPGPAAAPRGEEQCLLMCLLGSSLVPERGGAAWLPIGPPGLAAGPAPGAALPSRRERLLAAPKASPPSARVA